MAAASTAASLGSSAGYSARVHHELGSWHRRGCSADASRPRAETCPTKTEGPVGAIRLFPDTVGRAVLGTWVLAQLRQKDAQPEY